MKIFFLSIACVLASALTLKCQTWLKVTNETSKSFNDVYFVDNLTGYAVGESGMIRKSIDGGESWIDLNSTINTHLNSISFLSSNIGFAVGNNGKIVKTTNGGDTWSILTSGTTSNLTDVSFHQGKIYLAGLASAYLFSPDTGITWQNINLNSSAGYTEKIQYVTANIGYVLTKIGSSTTRLYKTEDTGLTWYLSNPTTINDVYFVNSNIGYAVGYTGIIQKTTDGGNTWNILHSGINYDLNSISFTSPDSGIIIGNNGIIKTSDGGNTWSILNTSGGKVVQMITSSFGYSLKSTSVAKTIDGGSSWTNLYYSGSANLNALHFINATYGYAVGNSGKIIKTINGGNNWSTLSSGITTSHFKSVFFTHIDTGYVVGTNGIIRKTTNGGANWFALTNPLPASLNTIFFVNSSIGFIVGNNGVILKTVNAGMNWTALNSNTTRDLISVHFTSAQTGYASGEGGIILKTTDGGNSWIIHNDFPEVINDFHFINGSMGYLASTTDAIAKTVNGGASWISQSSGMVQQTLNSIDFINGNIGCAVGDNGSIIRTINGGQTWDSVYSGAYTHFKRIFFINNSAYSVGLNGTVIKTQDAASSWNHLASGTDFKSISGSGNVVYAVGGNNVIKKSTDRGKKWHYLSSGIVEHFTSVHCVDSSIAYVVGTNNTILKTIDGGLNWTALQITNLQIFPYGNKFNKVYFINKDTGYVAHTQSMIFKTTDGGINWSMKPSGSTITDIHFADNNIGYSSTSYGYILKTINGGDTWNIIYTSTNNYFNSIFFTSADTGFITSYTNNSIMKTVNGGTSWLTVATINNPFSIYFPTSKTGYLLSSYLYKTSDSGNNWQPNMSIGFSGESKIFFPNQDLGLIVSEKGKIFRSFIATANPIHVSCNGGMDGAVNLNVNGLSSTYTYQWSNGATTQTINNLSSGVYGITVTDTAGNTATTSIEILQPSLPVTTSVQMSNIIRCSGSCTDSISLFVTGGTPPYTYVWSSNAGNQTTATPTSLCAGNYIVTISDINNCTLIKNIRFEPTTTADPNLYLTNLAAVDLTSVSPDFSAYYVYNLPSTISPNPSNPRNFVDPGKYARFKVESRNKKTNGQSVVSGICKVRSNSPHIQINDSSSALNNIGWNNYAWSADEFEIFIDPNTPAGTNAYIDFIIQESGQEYATTCIAVPITPLVYSPTTALTIDDDNNPDSYGNDNDLCEPGEIIEFYPWLDNVSTLNADYVRGRFENLDNHSFINIWNNQPGVGTTVYDATWWNFGFAQPQTINASSVNTTPEYDFVFNYNGGNVISDFKLYMVMAGGFKLFTENALSLVQWTLPYTFNNTASNSVTSQFDDNRLSIFPNPSEGIFHIQSKGLTVNQIKIFNSLGAQILDPSAFTIDLRDYPKGVYIIQVCAEEATINKKIIIQ